MAKRRRMAGARRRHPASPTRPLKSISGGLSGGTSPGLPIALGRVGETGLLTLREQARSEDRAVREAAMDALLPYANPDDLTTLYEYIGFRTEDDPEVRARVLEKAAEIEQILEELQLAEAASAETEPEEDPDAEN